jgi:PAP2 superfamily
MQPGSEVSATPPAAIAARDVARSPGTAQSADPAGLGSADPARPAAALRPAEPAGLNGANAAGPGSADPARPAVALRPAEPARLNGANAAGPGSADPAGLDTAQPAVTAGPGSRARPRWWAELAMLGVGYGLYTLTRDLAPARRQAAFADAAAIRAAESWLHLGVERGANLWLTMHPVLATMADYYYATAHFAAVIGMLVWLYWRRPGLYRRARSVLVAVTLTALAVFWLFPVAPPRLLPGYVDTLVARHTWGSWGTAGVASLANPYAAMPSLHTAWAAWTAGVIMIAAGRASMRIAAAAYPLLTIAVIVATANHYVLDAVGGLVALAAAAMAIHAADPAWTYDAARLPSPVRSAAAAHALLASGRAALPRLGPPGYRCAPCGRRRGSPREAHAHGCGRAR